MDGTEAQFVKMKWIGLNLRKAINLKLGVWPAPGWLSRGLAPGRGCAVPFLYLLFAVCLFFFLRNILCWIQNYTIDNEPS